MSTVVPPAAARGRREGSAVVGDLFDRRRLRVEGVAHLSRLGVDEAHPADEGDEPSAHDEPEGVLDVDELDDEGHGLLQGGCTQKASLRISNWEFHKLAFLTQYSLSLATPLIFE